MDQYEQAVLDYVCGCPDRFVNLQFTIPYADSNGGSCPDFVALDFADKTVYVVEVTAAADTKSIIKRIRERETRWLNPLRSHFGKLNSTFKQWEYHVTIFVRDDNEVNAVQRITKELSDVSVLSIQKALFSWKWEWNVDSGVPTNALREPGKCRANRAAQ